MAFTVGYSVVSSASSHTVLLKIKYVGDNLQQHYVTFAFILNNCKIMFMIQCLVTG